MSLILRYDTILRNIILIRRRLKYEQIIEIVVEYIL